MPITIECDGCGKTYRVKEQLIGRRIKCKACDEPIKVTDPEELDEFEDLGAFDEDEEFEARLPTRSPRKKKKAQKSAQPAAGLQAFNTFKTIVMVLIGIVVIGFGRSLAYSGGFFMLRIIGGAGSAAMMILGLANLVTVTALGIGGLGIFQRQDWGDRVTWAGALGMAGVTIVGTIVTAFWLTTLGEKFGGIGVASGSLVAGCAYGCVIPGAILYCMNHADWDEPA